jgi:hypothetical protein
MNLAHDEKMYNKSGDVSLFGFVCGYNQIHDKYGRHKMMSLYQSTFRVVAYLTGEKILVKQEFNIDELTKARRFYRSIRLFKNHSTWLQE